MALCSVVGSGGKAVMEEGDPMVTPKVEADTPRLGHRQRIAVRAIGFHTHLHLHPIPAHEVLRFVPPLPYFTAATVLLSLLYGLTAISVLSLLFGTQLQASEELECLNFSPLLYLVSASRHL